MSFKKDYNFKNLEIKDAHMEVYYLSINFNGNSDVNMGVYADKGKTERKDLIDCYRLGSNILDNDEVLVIKEIVEKALERTEEFKGRRVV